jgi:hypothetical protein
MPGGERQPEQAIRVVSEDLLSSRAIDLAPGLLPSVTGSAPLDDRKPGPWRRTADAGIAIGDAAARGGVKTAAFFKKVGVSLARSF